MLIFALNVFETYEKNRVTSIEVILVSLLLILNIRIKIQ